MMAGDGGRRERTRRRGAVQKGKIHPHSRDGFWTDKFTIPFFSPSHFCVVEGGGEKKGGRV